MNFQIRCFFAMTTAFFSAVHGNSYERETLIEKHFKKPENKNIQTEQIKYIDYIYIINLDNKVERFERLSKQFAYFGLTPYRFSAIYGWDLLGEPLDAIGLKFLPSTNLYSWREWVLAVSEEGKLEHEFLREGCYGKTIFSPWMTLGAIGCALSHLSILQDAYASGYETIWVVEDDLYMKEDPHRIANHIEKLDRLVGHEAWDILYTHKPRGPYRTVDQPITKMYWYTWRPDYPPSFYSKTIERTKIDPFFEKVGGTFGTCSMIIRRSGMKKILDHVKKHGFFNPIDVEIAFVQSIQLYTLTYNMVSWSSSDSDVKE